MRLLRRYLISFLIFTVASTAIAAALPELLELEYDLIRSGISVGEVSRTLQRRADGNYLHTAWTRPTGFARLLTQSEWREEGEFVVQNTTVRPRRFSETRSGDKRAYEHRVTFNQEKSQITFTGSASHPMPSGLQDQGSIIYTLMLDPLAQPGERILPLTDGKDIETYRFTYQGKESLATPFGTRETIVIRRVSLKRSEHEQRCRTQPKSDPDCEQPDDFTYWLLPEKNYVPVKLERRRKDETTTMMLRKLNGQ